MQPTPEDQYQLRLSFESEASWILNQEERWGSCLFEECGHEQSRAEQLRNKRSA